MANQMKRNDAIYREELLKRLFNSPNLKKEREFLNRLFEQPILCIVAQPNLNNISILSDNSLCSKMLRDKRKVSLKCLRQVVARSKKTHKVEQFLCSAQSYGLCLPLIQGDTLYGFLILCNLKNKLSLESLRLVEALNSTILEKTQKELELSKLYQSIRPRAIALSTIHTVRRLISSSLDLDELLPRIARLSLQVLRARRCVISLFDKKSKQLIPKAIIDLSKRRQAKFHISSQAKRIENKVMRTGNILLKNSYLSVPLIDEEPIGIITVFHKITKKAFDNYDREILTALSEQAVGAIKNAQLYKEQENMLLGTVKSLSTLLRVKSAYPYAHSKAFVTISLRIAKELKLSKEDLRDLRYAAMLHDAGKIGIPDEILKKPAHLTGKEFRIVKEQPKKSAMILSPLERLKPAMSIILHHHEKFDGTGYPDRLKGEKIPLGARIMAVADSFEAIISRRPYRKSISISEAIKEIKRHSGTQFDPLVIKAFLKLVKSKSFKKLIQNTHHD
jgi:HD-GYP domain-containing protein (c-di-GMP phosphodiesterase class II)